MKIDDNDSAQRKKLKPFNTNDELKSQALLKQLTRERVLKSSQFEADMPEWKRQLIEKRKQQQQNAA